MVKKDRLGLLNPVTSAKVKYPSSQQASAELIWDVTGGGAFSNEDHLLALREERGDWHKNRNYTNDATLNSLVGYLKGTYLCLILRARNTCACLKVRGTTVTGKVLSTTKFRDLLCKCNNVTTLNLQRNCDRCGIAFEVCHTVSCSKVGLVIAIHNIVWDELL